MDINPFEPHLSQAIVAAQNASRHSGVDWEVFASDSRTESVSTFITTKLKTPVRYREYVDCPTIGLEAGGVKIEIWEGDDRWECNELRKDTKISSSYDTLEEAIYDAFDRAEKLEPEYVLS